MRGLSLCSASYEFKLQINMSLTSSPDSVGSVRAAIEKLNEPGVKNDWWEWILLSISSSLGELQN